MKQAKAIVDSFSDEIVNIVNSFDNESDFRKTFTNIGKNQFSKLLNLSKRANSIEELKLFIVYQASKDNNWNNTLGKSTLSKMIIQKLNDTLALCNKNELGKKGYKYPDKQEDLIELKLKFGEKYFGYLYWKSSILYTKKEVNKK